MFTWFQKILRFNLLPRNNILPGRWHLKYKKKTWICSIGKYLTPDIPLIINNYISI